MTKIGRPSERTVPFFPFYVKDGDTLFLLESKYKCEGTGFFTGVLRFLCQTSGHHYRIESFKSKLRFFATIKVDQNTGLDMLEIMASSEKIDPVLWKERSVIYSQDLVDSLHEAYRKRVVDAPTLEEIYELYKLPYTPPNKGDFPPEKPTIPPEKPMFPQGQGGQTILDKTKLDDNHAILVDSAIIESKKNVDNSEKKPEINLTESNSDSETINIFITYFAHKFNVKLSQHNIDSIRNGVVQNLDQINIDYFNLKIFFTTLMRRLDDKKESQKKEGKQFTNVIGYFIDGAFRRKYLWRMTTKEENGTRGKGYHKPMIAIAEKKAGPGINLKGMG